jgi:hypothetical protein
MEHLPPWLRNLPLPPRPAAADSAAAAAPAWLRDHEGAAASDANEPAAGGAADVPDWLRDPTAGADAPPQAPIEPADAIPAWLRELAAEPAPEPGAAHADRPAPSGATSWLKGLADDAPADDAPEAPPEPPTTTSRVRLPVGATDWLRSIGQETEPSSPEPQPASAEPPTADESGVPDWLRDVTPEELASAVAADLPVEQDDPSELDPSGPSWLADLAAEARPADEDSISGAVPDWLADLTSVDAGSSNPRADDAAPDWLTADDEAAEDEAAPDWLRDLSGAAAPPPAHQAPPDKPAPPPVGADEVPAWLRDAEAADAAPPPVGADEVPAWLRDAEAADAAPPPVGADEVPAWLRDAEAAPAAPDAGADIPTWLRDISEPTSPPIADDAPRQGEPADADVPTWLRDAMREEAERETIQPLQSEGSADVPRWLSDDTGASDEPRPITEPQGEMNLPSWLRGVAEEPAPAPALRAATSEPTRRAPAPDDAEGDDFLRGSDLPPWLRGADPERSTETAEGQTVDWLTSLGSAETENETQESAPANKVVVQPRQVYQRTSEQLEAVELLSRLVNAPYPTPIAPPEPLPQTRWQRVGIDRILYALLLLALLIGLLVPGLSGPFQTTTPVAPGAADLREVIAGLDSEQVVLLAYEWAAQRSGELRPLEDAVTERLVEQQAKLIIVSTDLQGTLISFDRIEPLREAGYNAAGGGTDYVLLGYRPGGELALRSLARDLRGELTRDFNGNDATGSLVATRLDGTPRVATINDLALIVVMADQPQDVQSWMEQVHRVAPTVPIAFVLPQETQPLVQPYLRLPNVHYIAGRQGALALQSGGATDPAQIAQATGQQNVAIFIFIVLLIGGAASVAIGRARRARES